MCIRDRVVTDSVDIDQPKDINSPLFQLYALFLNENEKKELKIRFEKPGLRYGDLKNELFECYWEYFRPFRDKRQRLMDNKDHVLNNLSLGATKAAEVANKFLDDARSAMGLDYY